MEEDFWLWIPKSLTPIYVLLARSVHHLSFFASRNSTITRKHPSTRLCRIKSINRVAIRLYRSLWDNYVSAELKPGFPPNPWQLFLLDFYKCTTNYDLTIILARIRFDNYDGSFFKSIIVEIPSRLLVSLNENFQTCSRIKKIYICTSIYISMCQYFFACIDDIQTSSNVGDWDFL